MAEIPDLTKNATPEEVAEYLKKYGIVRVKNYLNDVAALKEDTLSVVKEAAGNYQFGKNVKTGSWLKDRSKHKEIHNVFDNKWMKKVTSLYLGKKHRYREGVFITHDFRDDRGLGRNGFLHFDRTRAFKFFFYLTDCKSLDCGPFMCFPGTHNKGKELRKTTPKGTKYAKIPNRLEIDFPELGYKAEDALPAFGQAGTLLIFDSDMFHLGGRVKKGHERLILRSHSRT